MQVRGLKREMAIALSRDNDSHLMQVRGLKPAMVSVTIMTAIFAPHAGAWIETEA